MAAASLIRQGNDSSAKPLLDLAERVTRERGCVRDESVRVKLRSAALNNLGCLYKRYCVSICVDMYVSLYA
jgi:hypothetical protein